MVSELDINLLADASRGADPAVANPYANGLPDDKQEQLAKRYAEIFTTLLAHRDSITRVTFWGVSDGDSWLNRGRVSYPLLFDRRHQPKLAFQAVADVLRRAGAASTASWLPAVRAAG
jgi:endo-1,4-beta-xylanase